MNCIKYWYNDQSSGNSTIKEAEILNALKDNTVHKLEIGYVKIDTFILQLFDHLSLNKSLKKLMLYHTKINTNIVKLYKILNQKCNINKLDIIGNDIDEDGVHTLAELLVKNTTITSLSIGESDLSTLNIVPIFDSLRNNTHLQKLIIECDALNYANFKSLITMLYSNMTLRHLELRMITLDLENLHIFADALRSNIQLEKLTVCNEESIQDDLNFINNEFMSIIIDALMYNSNLKYFEICSGYIDDTDALMIANLLKTNTSLETLKLYDTNIEINGAINLCKQSQLKYLDIYIDNHMWISNNTINELSEVLRKNTTLTTLGINGALDDYFWNSLISSIQENYTIINILNLDPEEESSTISDFLTRNRRIADETRFKKVKPLMLIQ